MYSREKRLKAIELYIKYDRSAATVIHEIGYPSRKLLPKWYAEHLKEQETGVIRDRYVRNSKYSREQKTTAVKYYFEHGRNIARTVRKLGYPSRPLLMQWCKELVPEASKKCVSRLQYTKEQKQECVIALCTRSGSAKDVALEHGVSRELLYNWKNDLLGMEGSRILPKQKDRQLPDDKGALIAELESLKKQIYRLQLEKDVMEATTEIIKKDPGVDRKKLTNKEKALLVGTLTNKYLLKELLDHVGLARSSYFYQKKIATMPDKYETLRGQIIQLFAENHRCYGYRRIYGALGQAGIRVSEKVVQQIMAEQQLIAISKRKRKYSSYQGEITSAVPNIIARDFHADAPNVKWLTDLTEFHIPAGKVYLSPIVDCFDGLLASWSIGTSPDAELVNSMLDAAISTLKTGEQPIIHSDRGAHYRWPGWLERMEEAGLTRSMSKKGCSPDNSACEGFFGRIKNEMFYNRSWAGVSIDEFIAILDEYLHWYNEKRIKMSLGAMSPLEYRLILGLVA
jgi:transposase InsO family protein/transposase-like protein